MNQLLKFEQEKSNLSADLNNQNIDIYEMIARELHDKLGPHLSAIQININELDKPNGNIEIGQIKSQVSSLLVLFKEIITDLRNQNINNLKIIDAVQEISKVHKSKCRIITEYQTDNSLELSIENQFASILMEAVNNALKHSEGDQIQVYWFNYDGNATLEVIDNGIGFENSEIEKTSFGIKGMQERAELIGGDLSIRSTEQGTVVQCTLTK